MHAPHDQASSEMFHGVARPHRVRDLAVVALLLALTGGFVAHAAQPAEAAPRRASAFAATTPIAPPCPDVVAQ